MGCFVRAFSPALLNCLCADAVGLALLLAPRGGSLSVLTRVPRSPHSPSSAQSRRNARRARVEEAGMMLRRVVLALFPFCEQWGGEHWQQTLHQMTRKGVRFSKPHKEWTCIVTPVNLLAVVAVWNLQMFCIPARGQQAEGLAGTAEWQHRQTHPSIAHERVVGLLVFPARTDRAGGSVCLGFEFWPCLLH